LRTQTIAQAAPIESKRLHDLIRVRSAGRRNFRATARFFGLKGFGMVSLGSAASPLRAAAFAFAALIAVQAARGESAPQPAAPPAETSKADPAQIQGPEKPSSTSRYARPCREKIPAA
jgi:hypothetical protein